MDEQPRMNAEIVGLRSSENAASVDIQKCRDLRSPHVNALIDEHERLSRKYEQIKSGLFQIQYGAVTITGVHELGVVIREHGEQKARIQQLLEAMDREVAARRSAEAEVARLRGGFQIDEQPA